MKEIEVPLSKSLVNRRLILQSFKGELPDQPPTLAEDVVDLHRALKGFLEGETHFHIRNGGTSLRFLLARISRQPGQYTVEVSQRLASRPIEELVTNLRELGIEVSLEGIVFKMSSEGWKKPDRTLVLDCARSTQFASAILLSSVDLNFHFEYQITNLEGSQPYLQMTLDGLELGFEDEIDLSSAFSLVACLAQKEDVFLKSFPQKSLQADAIFPELLSRMGVVTDGGLFRKFPSQLKAIDVNLSDSPDLLPVLSTLCALTPEESKLSGLKNLVYKESNRIEKTLELLTRAGAEARQEEDTLTIRGPIDLNAKFEFDPDHDHRIAMAATVMKTAGIDIQIQNPKVVDKSLPGFFKMIGVQP